MSAAGRPRMARTCCSISRSSASSSASDWALAARLGAVGRLRRGGRSRAGGRVVAAPRRRAHEVDGDDGRADDDEDGDREGADALDGRTSAHSATPPASARQTFRFLKVRQARGSDRLRSLRHARWRSIGFPPPPSLLRAPVSLGGHRGSCCLRYDRCRPMEITWYGRACFRLKGTRRDRHHRPLPALDRLRRRQARRRAADDQPRPSRPRVHALHHRRPDPDAARRVRVQRPAGDRHPDLPRRRGRRVARREHGLLLRDRRRPRLPSRRPRPPADR